MGTAFSPSSEAGSPKALGYSPSCFGCEAFPVGENLDAIPGEDKILAGLLRQLCRPRARGYDKTTPLAQRGENGWRRIEAVS